MKVKLYSRLSSGDIRTFDGVPTAIADRMFAEHKKIMQNPFVTYYRVTLEDPMRGGYVVRDSDLETYGIGGTALNGDASATDPGEAE